MNKSSSLRLLKKGFDLNKFIKNALQEDIGNGDHTSLSTIPIGEKNKASLIIKDNGIIAGVELAKKIFYCLDKSLVITTRIFDGAKVRKGDIAFIVSGNARSILSAERVMLNCMQRMSGIATLTNEFVKLCGNNKTKILDTRKTTPGMREIEKWAVRIGRGHNHRFGLYDMILIKNNHIDFAGGISAAINGVTDYLKRNRLKLKIEIEARNLKEVTEILATGKVDRILLDNFSIYDIRKAIKLIDNLYETEISGGINKQNIKKYAACGADYISVGALTHSIKSLDMSLTAS